MNLVILIDFEACSDHKRLEKQKVLISLKGLTWVCQDELFFTEQLQFSGFLFRCQLDQLISDLNEQKGK